MPPWKAGTQLLRFKPAIIDALHSRTRALSIGPIKDVLAERNFECKMLVEENLHAMLKSGLRLPPLHFAARHGLFSILMLMARRINREHNDDTAIINTPYSGRSPLMWAIESRYPSELSFRSKKN